MKRTKESFNKDFFRYDYQGDLSGCKDFQGEDLDYDSRIELNKQQQREWILEKIRENEKLKQDEKQEEHDYASQTNELNRMRFLYKFTGLLEDEFLAKKKKMREEMRDTNIQLQYEKNSKDQNMRNSQLNFEKEEAYKSFKNSIKTQFSPLQSQAWKNQQ